LQQRRDLSRPCDWPVGLSSASSACKITEAYCRLSGDVAKLTLWHAARQGWSFTAQPGQKEKEVGKMPQTNENAVRNLLERWAAAVRAKNVSEVLANHSPDFRMFDVPPPFESRGLAAYEDTWRLFYSNQPDPVAFDIKWLEVVAGDDVAFAFAHMQCVEPTEKEQRTPLDFRLTVGLRKVEGRWVIMHEHHSVPAT
jgi:uncharacterized protein (TIGR02246 family)